LQARAQQAGFTVEAVEAAVAIRHQATAALARLAQSLSNMSQRL
jgi:hypothetical protein